MTWLLLRRALAGLRRGRFQRELDEEIRHHLELRTRALIDEGMDPREAQYEARRTFGNVTGVRERSRDVWSFPLVDSLVTDAAYGTRIFRRHPVFSVVALVSVATAVAASTGVFAVMNAAMLRPLPGAHETVIHRLYTSGFEGATLGSSSYPDYQSLGQLPEVFSATCATRRVRLNLQVNAVARAYTGQVASADCFALLQLTPARGRFYRAADADRVPIVVSYRLWQRDMLGDAQAIGRPLRINGRTATIVGVAPRGFLGTDIEASSDFWIPPSVAVTVSAASLFTDRTSRAFVVYVRLADGVSEQQASAALGVLARRLQAEHPTAWSDSAGGTRRFTIIEERRARFATAPDGGLFIVGSVAGIIVSVVAIACINLATMLLALGSSRTREISIRLALGASYSRVLRQLVTECLTIGLCGSALGLFVVYVAREILLNQLPPEMPGLDVAVDWRVILVAGSLGLVTPLLFGLAPALHSVRLAIAEGMKPANTRGRLGRIAFGFREGLIVLQVAASCALLLISTLFALALVDARAADPGFRTRGIGVVEVDVQPGASSPDAQRVAMRRLLARAGTAEAVNNVTMAAVLPLSGSATHFSVRTGPDREPRMFDGNVIGPGYFEVMGVPILAGRDFDERDSHASIAVAVVNRAFVRALWNVDSATGRSIVLDGDRRVEIVGVVGDTRYRTLHGPPEPLIFLPFEQRPRPRMVIHAPLTGTEGAAALERAIRHADDRVLVGRTGTVDQWLELARMPDRVFQWVGAAGGVLQLALALMGVWALIAYTVQRRSSEMSIRLALGAAPVNLIALTMRPSLILVVAGIAFGVAGGLGAGTVLRSTASDLAGFDIALAVPVGIALFMAAALAAWIPARAVAHADPAATLRHE